MLPTEKYLFSKPEAAAMLSMSLGTLDVALARGMLRARRNGRRVMIERREIEKFSRVDHPRIWALDGSRGTSVAGRVCFDCSKDGRKQPSSGGLPGKPVPAERFYKNVPVCNPCWDRRIACGPKRVTSRRKQLAGITEETASAG